MLSFSQISQVVKDNIFPAYCLGCKAEGDYICRVCSRDIINNESTEFFNQGGSAVKILFSQMLYDEKMLAGRAFKIFKYDFVEDIFKSFEPLIREYFEVRKKYFENIDSIIPIPLHPRRYAERGFNQSEILAKTIGQTLGKEVLSDAIFRVKYTKNQARLNKKEREDNIRDAFELNKKYDYKNKVILLVDDVFTTGATMGECGKLLKQKNTQGVYAFTLFRGN